MRVLRPMDAKLGFIGCPRQLLGCRVMAFGIQGLGKISLHFEATRVLRSLNANLCLQSSSLQFLRLAKTAFFKEHNRQVEFRSQRGGMIRSETMRTNRQRF